MATTKITVKKTKKSPIEEKKSRPAKPAAKPVKKEAKIKPLSKPVVSAKPLKYIEAVGRRKTAVARVRLYTKKEGFKDIIVVNDKSYKEYFPLLSLQKIVESSLEKMKSLDRFAAVVKVGGGGFHAQAEAIRHGLALVLAKFNPDFKKRLRRAGFITRDSRIVERKKYGLKKARRAPQWAKR